MDVDLSCCPSIVHTIRTVTVPHCRCAGSFCTWKDNQFGQKVDVFARCGQADQIFGKDNKFNIGWERNTLGRKDLSGLRYWIFGRQTKSNIEIWTRLINFLENQIQHWIGIPRLRKISLVLDIGFLESDPNQTLDWMGTPRA